ncbi:hypothetical protein Barb6_00213 [Bacteroidales bacterium Barb6]|nr:hypothetical protein Barb6_00213 [Bacteroidales bacterium Barb6]
MKNIKEKFHLQIIIGTSLCMSLFFYFLSNHYFLDDGPSYRNAKNLIEDASFDIGRTPVYPLIIASVRLFCEDPYLTHIIVFIQIAIFILSIPFFRYIAFTIAQSDKISFCTTLLYACCPHIIYWNRCTMTESLAATGLIFFLYYIIRYLHTNKYQYIMKFHILIFFLIMLRPSLLYLIPIIIIFWGYILIVKKKIVDFSKGIFFTIVSILLILGYATGIKKEINVLSLTNVSIINQYILFSQSGLLDNVVRLSPVSFELDNFNEIQPEEEIAILTSKYGYKIINDFLQSELKYNFKGYLLAVFSNLQQAGKKLVFIPGGFQENDNSSIGEFLLKSIVAINLFFLQLYVFLLFYVIIFIYIYLKNRKLLLLPVLLWMIVCANLAVIFLGAYGQYSRLMVPVYPIIILMFGVLACFIKVKIQSSIVYNRK